MSYTITQIEDAIIAALEPLKSSRGVRLIDSYREELDSEEDIQRAVRNFPALLVVYSGSRYAEHGSRKVQWMSFTVFVMDKSLREAGEQRRGGAHGPGAYVLLDDTRDTLVEQRLSLDIYPFRLVGETPVWFGKGIAVYAAEYETAQALLYTGD